MEENARKDAFDLFAFTHQKMVEEIGKSEGDELRGALFVTCANITSGILAALSSGSSKHLKMLHSLAGIICESAIREMKNDLLSFNNEERKRIVEELKKTHSQEDIEKGLKSLGVEV